MNEGLGLSVIQDGLRHPTRVMRHTCVGPVTGAVCKGSYNNDVSVLVCTTMMCMIDWLVAQPTRRLTRYVIRCPPGVISSIPPVFLSLFSVLASSNI